MIDVKNLWKNYGNKVVLEGINVSVKEGEFITLVGASGCGKSTFLKLLLGTETASKGSLLLDGKPIKGEPDSDRGIVFQQYSVFPHMTVLENVIAAKGFAEKGITGLLWGRKRKEAKAAAERMLDKVGLSSSSHLYPHHLSGGMRQRLAIAQALMGKPRILLLDEPFGALDPGIRKDMHALVLDLWRSEKLTVFMVTHDLHEGFYLGTRLWVFDKLRHDPQAPDAFGAGITFDLPVGQTDPKHLETIEENMKEFSHD
ncbi:ABC transporter ATP-binding protein [Nitrincola schmidtii]|uniref:ABC transporter ATP-binding protein n=1 Tax=Nitrincola schmidtii TaxID=1730894 RepID=UPI00124CEE94|nr:ABC transporter ATP-binding protein [Nitrincola schmidtii]